MSCLRASAGQPVQCVRFRVRLWRRRPGRVVTCSPRHPAVAAACPAGTIAAPPTPPTPLLAARPAPRQPVRQLVQRPDPLDVERAWSRPGRAARRRPLLRAPTTSTWKRSPTCSVVSACPPTARARVRRSAGRASRPLPRRVADRVEEGVRPTRSNIRSSAPLALDATACAAEAERRLSAAARRRARIPTGCIRVVRVQLVEGRLARGRPRHPGQVEQVVEVGAPRWAVPGPGRPDRWPAWPDRRRRRASGSAGRPWRSRLADAVPVRNTSTPPRPRTRFDRGRAVTTGSPEL